MTNKPLEFLHGVWKGRGKGIYPTIKSFEYNEEITVTGNSGNSRPVLHYRQRSWSRHTHPRPMHEETGWIRALVQTDEQGCQRCEWVLSAQNGVSTIEEGSVRGTAIYLHSTAITRSSTAKEPFAIEFIRTFKVDLTQDPPVLHYTMDMATTCTPMTRHLEAWLTRQPTYSHLGSPSGLLSPGQSGQYMSPGQSGQYMSPGQSGSFSQLSGMHSDSITGRDSMLMVGSGSWPAGLSMAQPARSSASMPNVLLQSAPGGISVLMASQELNEPPGLTLSGYNARTGSAVSILQSQSLGDVVTPTFGSGRHVLAQALLSLENGGGSNSAGRYALLHSQPSDQAQEAAWGNGGTGQGPAGLPTANGNCVGVLANADSGGSTTAQLTEPKQEDSKQSEPHHLAPQSHGTCPYLH